jgi:3-dehydroquinate synthase
MSGTGRRTAVTVALGERCYRIHVGRGLLAESGRLIASPRGGRAFVITHAIVDRLHGGALREGLGRLEAQTISVPVGERQKSIRRAAVLWDELLARGADRRSTIIAFGGGVIGDLAGFVAATYMRGLPYVQVPTTLLAQVDSSVGGKVAINHPRAKNLIGAFHQPLAVIADVAVLATLRPRDYREGLAEVVKTALIADADLFRWLEEQGRLVMARDPDALAHLVRRCCEIKAHVVAADERESGPRAMLNLGHTVAHALEALGGYRRLRHGQAVSIGMVVAARIARRLGRAPAATAERLVRLLGAFGLPARIPGAPAAAILAAARADKKAIAGIPRFVLPRGIGRVEWDREVPVEVVKMALKETGASG